MYFPNKYVFNFRTRLERPPIGVAHEGLTDSGKSTSGIFRKVSKRVPSSSAQSSHHAEKG
jgi:hypothetical protein